MYLLPQEIEVWYIIPKLRKEMALRFIKKYGLTYEKTGEILGVTKAAISQYTKNKRANKIKLSSEMKKEVEYAVDRIYKKESSALIEIQRLLRKMKETKCACDVCKKYNKNILGYCNCEPKY